MNEARPAEAPTIDVGQALSLTAALRERLRDQNLTRREILQTLDRIDSSLGQPPAVPAVVPAEIRGGGDPPNSIPGVKQFSGEQMSALRMAQRCAASTGARSMKVVSPPGGGKTTLLRGMTYTLKGRGLYVAFGKANQVEAEAKLPDWVRSVTAHSMARPIMRDRFPSSKLVRAPFPSEIVERFGFTGQEAKTQAWVVRETFNNFCNGMDEEVGFHHVPQRTRELMFKRARESARNDQFAAAAVERDAGQIALWAKALWQEATDPKSSMPITHDAYLKLWAQTSPKLNFDYMLVDEAQDLNPVMLSILTGQTCPVIYVGDPFQGIYGWRGAVNAIESLDVPEAVMTQSFRFGPNIAEAANAVIALVGAKHRIIGAAANPGHVGPADFSKPYAYLARTTAGLCYHAVAVCDKRPTAVIGGTKELVELLESTHNLWLGQHQHVKHMMLRQFTSFAELETYSEESGDTECKFLVKLMGDRSGDMPNIIHALRTKIVAPAEAEVVLSTLHKAKGLEFPQVVLANDFKKLHDKQGRLISREEVHLLYVGASRAMHHLAPNNILTQILEPEAAPELEEV